MATPAFSTASDNAGLLYAVVKSIRAFDKLELAGVGLLLAAMTAPTKPVGVPITCPQCASSYSVHIAAPRMRCPVCSARLVFPAQ